MEKIILNNKIDHLCNEIIESLNCSLAGKKIVILGIDGPTASGKTIFAKNLSNIYTKFSGKKAFIYQFDWLLAERNARHKDQSVLFNSEYIKRFELEAELHMQLKKAEIFLKKIHEFNIVSLQKNSQVNFKAKLKNLYSREDEGQLTGKMSLSLEPGSLVILEGHYTLRPEFNKYIDTNILMLGNKDTLLHRKISRVSNYRGAEEAKEYFHAIDAPSFESHIERFGQNAKFVIQNDNFKNPFFITRDYLVDWINEKLPSKKIILKNSDHYLHPEDFLADFFSISFFLPPYLIKLSEILFIKLQDLDFKINEKIISSVDTQKESLTQLLEQFILNCNKEVQKKWKINKKLKLRFANSLSNVYFRVFPISFGVSIEDEDYDNFSMLFDFYEEKLQVSIAWRGGVRFLTHHRAWDVISKKKFTGWTIEKPIFSFEDNSKTLLLTPTNFTVPPFFNSSNSEIYFTGKEHLNISPSECFKKLLNGNTCWVARLALQDELTFFNELCILLGAQTIIIGNYLIALITKDQILYNNFKNFVNEWESNIEDFENVKNDKALYDRAVIAERSQLNSIVGLDNPHFLVFDTHLFLKQDQLGESKIDSVTKNLTLFLNSQNRLLRKRTVQFINRQFGVLNLPIKKMWLDFSDNEATITLDSLSLLQPSIMAEIYLWLAIKKSPSAILGANIYDISKTSLDALGHLQAASIEKSPVILQSSLNAIGQDDGFGKGYLRVNNGAKDMVDAIISSLRYLYIKNQAEPPLFGIGLDHIDSRNDIPSGRAQRFLVESLKTKMITHIVLDGSSLFHADDKESGLKLAYDKVAKYATNLLKGVEHTFLIDKEICAGELNYIGSSKLANIPDKNEIKIFVNALKKHFRANELGGFLRRPILFVANVGTTHHSGDVGEVRPEITKVWVDEVKNNLFVSAVLHGTTGTKPNVLMRSTSGCKKINIAGDFLTTYVSALPEKIRDLILKENNEEPKKNLAFVRDTIQELPELDKKIVIESILEHSRSIIQCINSPKLTKSDINFFRYSPFIFSEIEIKEIMFQIKSKYETFSHKNEFSKQYSPGNKEFCASLIEVPYGSEFVKIAKELMRLGVKNFHIDVGDGDFISRQFSGLLKLKKLKQISAEIEANVHLMVRDCHLKSEDNLTESYIESYARSGCTKIGIHINSFSNEDQIIKCLQQIRHNGCKPGIVLEIDEPFNNKLRELILQQKISWVVVMGVRIGFGGQIFNTAVLEKIQMLRAFSDQHNKNIQIEVDGGLTFDNIHACIAAGANNFAGWSIIKPDNKYSMREKLLKINKILSDNKRLG